MNHRKSFAAFAFTFALAGLGAAGPAAASPNCHAIIGTVRLAASTSGPCSSPIALCATGELRGTLRGNSDFTGTSSLPTVDTAATSVVLLTGDNVIHTRRGDLFTKDAIVLATAGDGDFAEVDTILGGTGALAGATGHLSAIGTFAAGVGDGTYVGELCVP
jgi:hypothetical protein